MDSVSVPFFWHRLPHLEVDKACAQVRIKIIPAEGVCLIREVLRDIGISQMLLNHRAVFCLRWAVVV